MKRYDVIVIGAGSEGKWIAHRLQAAGRSTALIYLPGRPETYHERLCAALFSRSLRHSAVYETLELPAASPHVYEGAVRLRPGRVIDVAGETLKANRLVVASGVAPALPAVPGLEAADALWPLDALSGSRLGQLLVIGGGATAIATAQALKDRGSDVLMAARADRLLTDHEPEFSKAVEAELERGGIRVLTSATVREAVSDQGRRRVTLLAQGVEHQFSIDSVVPAVGLRPALGAEDLASSGIIPDERGWIMTDDTMRTSMPGVYALGGATGHHNLALARHQASVIAHNLFAPLFDRQRVAPEPLPVALPFRPAIATLGKTEAEAKAEYSDAAATFHRWPSPHPNRPDILIKLIGRRKSGQLAGAHICAPEAGELILYLDLAMRAGISLEELVEAHHYPALTAATYLRQAIADWVEPRG